MKVEGMEKGPGWGAMINMYSNKLYKTNYESVALG